MYYLVESENQLDEIINKGYKEVFIEPIYYNDNLHPKLNEVSLLYIRPINGRKGYIVGIYHSEVLPLDNTRIDDLLATFDTVYVRDRKSFLYFYRLKNVIDIGFEAEQLPEITTNSHDYFYRLHGNKKGINTLIPVGKHYEKCEKIYKHISKQCVPDSKNNKYYNKLTNVFYYIEQNGILTNKNILDEFFKLHNDKFSIRDEIIYTQYHLHTTTGRPSNAFNGINFAALKKNDGCRQSFIPKNDYFMEIDFSAFHPSIVGKLVGFDFGNESPYEYFAREAEIELKDAKLLMIKQLYGGVYKDYENIDYFAEVKQYTEDLWTKFNTDGYIECPISGYKFEKSKLPNINPPKLLNYVIQNAETTTNVTMLWDVIKLLINKNTKIVLYTYDSYCFDVDHDESDILEDIKEIFKTNKLKIKATKGKNYGKMLPI